ncbi:MAG: dienelactone hydrolase family protein [Novosphingobium sp.]|nr:dienelactone hydrolase family protein [Novosphingobium sp.]
MTGGEVARRWIAGVTILLSLVVSGVAHSAETVGRKSITLVDASRSVKASSGFAGSPQRRLDVTLWYPARGSERNVAPDAAPDTGGPWPLVIYSHGTFGRADNAMHIVEDLVRNGYVVAAPDYPLTSSAAYTRSHFADISDVIEQTRDVRFIIDSLLANDETGPMIDAARIGATGHSLGGVTSYFASFGLQTRDPRIRAAAMIGAGDPVQSALSSDMGLWGTAHAPVAVPALFLSAEKDVFARTTGQPYAAYARLRAPKYEVMVKGGVHVWFRDGAEQPADNKNPDCLFFEKWMPDVRMPGCEEREPLVGPGRQQEITRLALRLFFDGYLKTDMAARKRLGRLDREIAAVELRAEP